MDLKKNGNVTEDSSAGLFREEAGGKISFSTRDGYEYKGLRVEGKFAGHVLPGTLFLLWGLIWFLELLRRRYTYVGGSLCHRARRTCSPRSYYFSVEVFGKILFTVVGITSEIINGGNNDVGFWPNYMQYSECVSLPGVEGSCRYFASNLQHWFHSTIHLGFFFSGLVDLAEYVTSKSEVFNGAGMLALSAAFMQMSLLFKSHSEMHEASKGNTVEAAAHLILCLPLSVTALSIFADSILSLVMPQDDTAAADDEDTGIRSKINHFFNSAGGWLLYIRAAGVCVAGTWLIHIPFVPETLLSTPMATVSFLYIEIFYHAGSVVFISCLVALVLDLSPKVPLQRVFLKSTSRRSFAKVTVA